MFDHLQGENVENYTCPVVDCPARNFFQDARVEKRCFELYKKLIIEEFCTLKFITPFITAKCTSHIEAYHASLWSQYCSKNVSHNIRSRVTEARVAASIMFTLASVIISVHQNKFKTKKLIRNIIQIWNSRFFYYLHLK